MKELAMLSKWGNWSGYGGVSGGLLLTYALRSLLGIESLSLITSIHHLVKLGTPFLLLALLTISLPILFMGWFLKNHKGTARWAYIITVALIILSFGLVDGLWNHTLKMIVFFLRGADDANMAGLPFPPVGSVFHEITGVLQFVTAIFGAYFGYQFVVNTRHLQ
jgi:hypothetical protein